jgi:hypothetical protein
MNLSKLKNYVAGHRGMVGSAVLRQQLAVGQSTSIIGLFTLSGPELSGAGSPVRGPCQGLRGFFNSIYFQKRSSTMKPIFKMLAQVVICGAAATLAGCGGGADTYYLTLRGVAATGLAIDGGTVDVQCVSGTGTATTLANGSYSVTISGGTGPCLVTVTKDSVVLHSIAPKSSTGTAIANVTPISDAIVQALVAAKGAVLVTDLVTSASAIPSNTDLSTVVTAVIEQVNAALALLTPPLPPLDLGTDLLGQANYVAATNLSPDSGDALDKALDALVAAGSGSLPGSLTTAITETVNSSVAPNPTGSVN